MRKELDLMLEHMRDITEQNVGGIPVYTGSIGSHEVVACQCGVGKVNSALRTSKIIDCYSPDLVINTGVAGSVDESMSIGSILVADRVTYHDVWCPGNDYGAVDGMPVYYNAFNEGLERVRAMEADMQSLRCGLICSGDIFVSKPEEVKTIKVHFPEALGCDMESTSIAQTCYIYKVPFMIIRVMSDMPGGGHNISEYENFWTDAPVKTFSMVSNLIESL